jgi:hypothetical protein
VEQEIETQQQDQYLFMEITTFLHSFETFTAGWRFYRNQSEIAKEMLAELREHFSGARR